MVESLYDRDFYSWAGQQAALLRSGRLDFADIANIAEEIETLGRSEAAALRSSYRLICMHLLKMMHQKSKATPSGENTVNRERLNVEATLKDNPGLKPKRLGLFEEAYAMARKEAAFETKLDVGLVPTAASCTLDDAESVEFWPEGFPRRVRR